MHKGIRSRSVITLPPIIEALRRPRRHRMPLPIAPLALASLVIMTVIAFGARAHQKNPTVDVTPPLPALLITCAVLVVVSLVAELLAELQRSQPDEGPTAG